MQGAGFRVQGAGCRVQGAEGRVQGARCRVHGSGFKVRAHLARSVPPAGESPNRPPLAEKGEGIFIELMTSDRKLRAS